MKHTRNRHLPAFKAKVALAAVQELDTIPVLAKRFGVTAGQIYAWKREFLANAERVFSSSDGTKSNQGSVSSEREDQLLKKIGELTVERDFLSRGLGRRD